jgi:hypothetical protein
MPLTIEPNRTRFSGTFGHLSACWSASDLIANFFKNFFRSPSGCLTGVDRVSLEMITKILFAIQAATRCFRLQTQFPSRFARQSEFSF